MQMFLISGLIKNLGILITTSGNLKIPTIFAGFKVSLWLFPFTFLNGLGEWIVENSLYIDFVIGAIFIDWVLGSFKHWLWRRDFHWRENIKGIIVKLLLTLAMGFVVEGLDYLTINDGQVITNILAILRITVFLYPAMSIIRSCRVISDGRFPPQRIYDTIENWTEGIGKKK